MKVTNTTKQIHDNPAGALLAAAALGPTAFIEGMEGRGQQELVASSLIPTRGSEDPRLTEWGFVLGDPLLDDPIFRPAALPTGWTRIGAGHAMWSHIVDGRGIKRISIFYKAAYYDRSAYMSVVNVGAACVNDAIYGEAAIPWNVLTEAEKGEALAALKRCVADGERMPDVYGDHLPRAKALLDEAPNG